MRHPVAVLSATALLALGAAVSLGAPPSPDDKKGEPAGGTYREQFKDEVLVKGARGPLTGVEIQSETYEKVEWKGKTGPAQNRPAAEILSLKYGDQTRELTQGMENFRAGQWAAAETEFRGVRSAVDAGKVRKMWAGRVEAYIGECRRRTAAAAKDPAGYEQAIDSFRVSLKSEPKSPLLDLIDIGLAECFAAKGDWDGAFQALDDLRKVGGEAGRPLWEGRARMAKGRLLERKGDVAGAASEFEDLASFAEGAAAKAPADSPDRKDLEALRVGGLVARCWSLYGRAESSKSAADMDAARKAFEGLPAATGGAAAGKAASANGLGGILLLQDKPREALEKFIEVEVTMFRVPEEVSRALWFKSKAYDRLGDAPARDQALKDLAEFYPWSEWAGRAR